jgi:hypothetical protein
MAKFMLPSQDNATNGKDEKPHAVNTDLVTHIDLYDDYINHYYAIRFNFEKSNRTSWFYATPKERDDEWSDVCRHLGLHLIANQ